MTIIPLEQAIRELTAWNETHPFELMAMRPPSDDYYRFAMFRNEVYKVCLTRMFMARTWLWMLSIMKPGAPANEEGAHLPLQREANEIAELFFPKGFTALNEGDQIITMTCRKFISTEAKLEVADE